MSWGAMSGGSEARQSVLASCQPVSLHSHLYGAWVLRVWTEYSHRPRGELDTVVRRHQVGSLNSLWKQDSVGAGVVGAEGCAQLLGFVTLLTFAWKASCGL